MGPAHGTRCCLPVFMRSAGIGAVLRPCQLVQGEMRSIGRAVRCQPDAQQVQVLARSIRACNRSTAHY